MVESGSGSRLPTPECTPLPKGAMTSSNASSDPDLLPQLTLLRERRSPYTTLLRDVIRESCELHLEPVELPVVEIGAGDGQLREWLPEALSARVLHTDPSDDALLALKSGFPKAKTLTTTAESLPLDDASAAAVLGLCSFDAVSDPATTTRQIARVLAPGGVFVHFLDMSTLLERPFQKLRASRLVPIPNVLSDPGDHIWPLDVVLVDASWLKRALKLARRGGVLVPTFFKRYVESFLGGTSSFAEALTRFKRMASDPKQRTALLSFLSELGGLRARMPGRLSKARLEPFHTSRYLLGLLETHFSSDAGFTLERAEVVTRSAWLESIGEYRYRSLCLGHERRGKVAPGRLLSQVPEPTSEQSDATLVEVGVFVFVARRTSR